MERQSKEFTDDDRARLLAIVADSEDPGVVRPDDQTKRLGDRIEAILVASGTKEQFEKFREERGLPPECGGCESRKEWLNGADDWMREVGRQFGQAAVDAISAFWSPVSLLIKKKTPPD